MKKGSSRPNTIMIFALILTVIVSTVAIAAVFSQPVQADEEIVLSNSSTTMETLRIINYEFTTRDIPEEKSAKLKIVLQNSGSSTAQGTLSLNSFPSDIATIDLNPSSVNYSIEPGSRQTFIFKITPDNVGVDTRQRVDLSVRVTPSSGDSVTIDDPTPETPNYPEDAGSVPPDDPFSIFVLPKGASVSEGTISPTGERQSITKSFTSYKDNSAGTLGSFTNSIPPTTISDGVFTNTAQGSIYNFLDSTTINDGAYTRIESTTDGNIKVGMASRNIPDSQYYTIQMRYSFETDVLNKVEVDIVSQDGTEIDKGTTYILNDYCPDIGATNCPKETRYFQLSEKETNWIKENNSVFITIENTTLNTDNEQMALYFAQILSTEHPLEITTADMKIVDSNVLEPDGTDSFDNTFTTEEVYKIQYTVKNEGDLAGTKVVSLNEGGTIIKQKSIDLNPGETGTVTFDVNRGVSGIYRYASPSTLSGTMKVYVEGGEPLPPIATISMPPEPNQYPNNTLATDPKNPQLIELSAANSLAPNSTITEYEWTFEWSGNTVTTTNETIEVMSPSTKGNYYITLTVTNDKGAEDITQQTLRAGTIGPVAPSRDDLTIGTGDQVSLDASGSYHPVGILPDRCITEYRWTLSDGTTLATNTGTCDNPPSTTASYTFMTSGIYSVELTVVDDMNNTDSTLRQITVNAPAPDAAIQSDKSERLVNNTFTFNASNSYTNEGEITEYRWKMGDGTTYTTTTPTIDHAYSSAGLYNPEVTVVNSLGGADTASTTVSVISEPFDVGIAGDTSGDTSTTFTFDNGPTDGRENVQEWTWEISDGTTYTNKDVIIHQFGSDGTYEVTLTGHTDEYGGFTDTETITVNVNQSPPVAVLNASYDDGSELYTDDVISFDASDSYDPDGTSLTYEWTIEGATYTSESVNDYSFSSTGTKDVVLTVTDGSGMTDTVTYTYTIYGDPQADLTADRNQAVVGEPVTFDASGSTSGGGDSVTITEYEWDFDSDGNVERTTADPITDYSYSSQGDKTATVTVVNSDGYIDDASTTVSVQEQQSRTYYVDNPTNKTPNNYQVEFTITRPPEMNTDYGSARFYQNGTELDYHLKSYNSSEATFVVELATLRADRTEITMKYGATMLNSKSNPEATYLVYDYHGSGMDQGVFRGDASDQGTYALLTPDAGGQKGSLRYGSFNTNIGLKATYDWRTWGTDSTPADSVNFVTYNNGNRYELEDPSGNGIHFAVVDHSADYCVAVNYSGQCDIGSPNNYSYDENWHTATASVANQGGGYYSYYFDSGAVSSPIFDGTLYGTGLGNLFGFSGRTGGSRNNHAVRDITVRKWVGEPMTVTGPGTYVYNNNFSDGSTDGWRTETGAHTVRNNWLASTCSTGYNTNQFYKVFDSQRSPDSIHYEARIAAVDSWDNEDIRLQFRDDSGWNTVEYATPRTTSDYQSTEYDCQGDYTSTVYNWSGTFNVTGTLYEVRVLGGKDQNDHDESIAIDYVVVEER